MCDFRHFGVLPFLDHRKFFCGGEYGGDEAPSLLGRLGDVEPVAQPAKKKKEGFMFRILGVLLALVLVFGLAFANNGKAEPQGNAFGAYGCDSAGATAKNPGQWFQALKVNPVAGGVLLGLNPAELAELENTTNGWDGFGETPNVGALIAFFCGATP